eukprot:TRINITY_DN71689_c0_g1_i3.p2 TRINITY_DN71689_c0_g1~~TRINITY_DN71689_c0_g1_i3.p2  ORF type:complete len:195 (-),score=21.13 TRINITY_DN71689_c0_g1_i3:158-742(-)
MSDYISEAQATLMQIQGDRAKLYNELRTSFLSTLTTKSKEKDQQYQQEVHRIGDLFNKCSISFKQIQESVANRSPIMSKLLSEIQNLEKKKLHLTLTSYILRKSLKEGCFSWERRPYYQGEKDQQQIVDIISGFKMLQRTEDNQNYEMFEFVNKCMPCEQDGIGAVQIAEKQLEEVIEEINGLVYSVLDLGIEQ